MSETLGQKFAFILGTALLLVVSVAWVDLIVDIRGINPIIKNPFYSQIFFTVLITIMLLGFIWLFDPFSTGHPQDSLEKSKLSEDRIVRTARVLTPLDILRPVGA